jgi:hypothetical protein
MDHPDIRAEHCTGAIHKSLGRPKRFGALCAGLDEAKAKGWAVVDMKNDWKLIFAWEQ